MLTRVKAPCQFFEASGSYVRSALVPSAWGKSALPRMEGAF
jgi:hypothetical protein